MYSQLAQKTQKIYRSEQAKASQLTEMKQELAKQNSLLTKAKGLCGKLLHRSKKNRTQLESKALHHDAVEQNNLNVNFTLQEVRQELEQSKRAAEYFKKQWYKSLVSKQTIHTCLPNAYLMQYAKLCVEFYCA